MKHFFIAVIIGALILPVGMLYANIGEAGLLAFGWPRAASIWFWANAGCTVFSAFVYPAIYLNYKRCPRFSLDSLSR